MVTELEEPYLRPTTNVLNSAHILLLLHPPNRPREPLHNLAPIPQVVLRSSDGGGGGDPLPPPPAGLGYYTRSQAADVFLRFHGGGGGDVDWRAWEERLEACPLGECPESIRPPRLCPAPVAPGVSKACLLSLQSVQGFSPRLGCGSILPDQGTGIFPDRSGEVYGTLPYHAP